MTGFARWIALGIFISLLVALMAARRRGARLLPVLDVSLAALVVGIIGARAGHVALHWEYFATASDEILRLSAGGLNWHGALLGALVGATLMAAIHRVDLLPLLDSAAFAVPILGAAIWLACSAANAAYGLEVRSLADYPAWLVVESADIYGMMAPRLALSVFGLLLSSIVLAGLLPLAGLDGLYGRRLWLALMQYGIGMALIDTFRADAVPLLGGRRADHLLDLAVAGLAAGMLVLTTVVRDMAGRMPTQIKRGIAS
jgi:prolipoprotein diacylglyceryltransferase